MSHVVDLSGTANWNETLDDCAGVLVLSPREFEQAVAYVAARPDELAAPALTVRRGHGRVAKPRVSEAR